VLSDMGVLSDPFARGMLAPPMAAVCSVVQHSPYRWRARSVTLAGLAARVLWFDTQVADAVGAGVEQVVVVGAGYDSRAWRCRRDGVQFFELDHGGTQQDKRRRAPGAGPTYVEADLTVDDAAEAIHDRGLDASRPALFVVEGVTMYLAEAVVRRLLEGLAQSSATGSRVAADFSPQSAAGSKQDERQRRLQRLARAGSTEGFRFVIDRPEAVALVESTGWAVTEVTSLRDAAHALVPRASGLPVDAINEHKTLVAGERLSG
jgi:methyltransferase (TIGR00027 family)